jgi:hypothetical protein
MIFPTSSCYIPRTHPFPKPFLSGRLFSHAHLAAVSFLAMSHCLLGPLLAIRLQPLLTYIPFVSGPPRKSLRRHLQPSLTTFLCHSSAVIHSSSRPFHVATFPHLLTPQTKNLSQLLTEVTWRERSVLNFYFDNTTNRSQLWSKIKAWLSIKVVSLFLYGYGLIWFMIKEPGCGAQIVA